MAVCTTSVDNIKIILKIKIKGQNKQGIGMVAQKLEGTVLVDHFMQL